MKPRHLKNAPITEALLDLRVQLPESTSLETLEAIHRQVASEFPTKRRQTQYQAHLNAHDPASSSQRLSDVGFMFWSADEKRAMQARLDGFSFSQLAPYGTWEELLSHAKEMWSVFRAEAQPTRITRIALRYINRLPLPQPMKLQDYLLTLPHLGPTFLPAMSGLLMRVVAPAEHGATVVLTQAIEEGSVTDAVVPVILDIDVFKNVDFPISEHQECWTVLESLRGLKNDVFFDSITEATGELFT